MISVIVFILLSCITVISQSTWLHLVALNGIIPNLSVILVVSTAVLFDEEYGRRVGLLTGLLTDILFYRIIGFYGLLYFLIGHFSGIISRGMSHNLLILPIVLILGMDLVFGLIQYIIFGFFSGDLDLGYHLLQTILPEAFYTTLFSLAGYPLTRLFYFWGEKGNLWVRDLISEQRG